jgi:hypothetical protein
MTFADRLPVGACARNGVTDLAQMRRINPARNIPAADV